MKCIPGFVALFFFASACGQPPAKKLALQEKDAIESLKPGAMATSADGWYMIATIDGKAWKASSVYPPEATSRIIGNYEDGRISLPYWSPLIAGQKEVFSDHNVVDYSPAGNPDFWGGRSGEMEITKVANGWVEGKFHFTATLKSSDKKVDVTDGFFRVKTN